MYSLSIFIWIIRKELIRNIVPYKLKDNWLVETTEPGYTLLKMNSTGDGDKTLIFWVHGGAFIIKEYNYVVDFASHIHEQIKSHCDLVLFDQKPRMEFTINQTLIDIRNKLEVCLSSGLYKNLIITGDSSGVLFAGTLLRCIYDQNLAIKLNIEPIKKIETVKIKSFISVSGMLFVSFTNNFLQSKLLEFYVGRGSANFVSFGCQAIDNVDTFVITNKNDYLFGMSIQFIQTTNAKSLIITDSNVLHDFYRYTDLKETQQTIASIVSYIKSQV